MIAWPRSAIGGAAWPAITDGLAARLLGVLQQLEMSQYLSPVELRELQFRQLGPLVTHAARTVPFYSAAGLPDGEPITQSVWSRLPILTRREVREAGELLRSRAVPSTHGVQTSAATSGSTGTPVVIHRTELSSFYWHAFTLREELWHRRDFGGRFATIRRDETRPEGPDRVHVLRFPDWGPPVATVYPTGPASLLDYRCGVAEQAAWLREEKPSTLLSLPSILLALARHCLAEGIELPSLRSLRSSGEALPATTRALCREAWGLDVADMYSAVETGYLAFQCPVSEAYHVQAEAALVEVLDDDGRECEPGQTGRVIVTPLHNFAMPLIRYALGDRAIVGAPCGCGRGLPVLARILGRERDMLLLPSGDRRFPHGEPAEMARIDAIMRHQIAQVGATEIEIRLVVRRPLTADEEARVLTTVPKALGVNWPARISYRDRLPYGPGGKFNDFQCEVV
jgi:phenylacetate-CoA ligase